MSFVKSPASVSIAEFDGRSVKMDAFASLKEAIHHHLSKTSHFSGGGWGTDQHLAALRETRELLDNVIAHVETDRATPAEEDGPVDD